MGDLVLRSLRGIVDRDEMERFWREHGWPMPEEVLRVPWYVKANDLIGGWCVMPADTFPSDGCWSVCDMIMSMEVAERIVALHNQRVTRRTDTA